MKHLLCVSLFVSTLGVAPQSLAQAPEMTKGVSVQMATTSNAMPMPEADRTDAWIVAVTGSGQLYFGTQSVTPSSISKVFRSPCSSCRARRSAASLVPAELASQSCGNARP